MQIAICDDISLHIELTEKVIKNSSCINTKAAIRSFTSAQELTDALDASYSPDIAILDIQMDEKDGISLAKEINTRLPFCSIIFLTAYINYAPDVYDADHIFLVLKSQMEERLPVALDRAVKRSLDLKMRTKTIKTDSGLYNLYIPDLIYMERVLRKTRIVTKDTELWASKKPEDLLKNTNCRVIRCHQSFYVNRDNIILLGKDSFLMTGNITVPISRSYSKAAKDEFLFG